MWRSEAWPTFQAHVRVGQAGISPSFLHQLNYPIFDRSFELHNPSATPVMGNGLELGLEGINSFIDKYYDSTYDKTREYSKKLTDKQKADKKRTEDAGYTYHRPGSVDQGDGKGHHRSHSRSGSKDDGRRSHSTRRTSSPGDRRSSHRDSVKSPQRASSLDGDRRSHPGSDSDRRAARQVYDMGPPRDHRSPSTEYRSPQSPPGGSLNHYEMGNSRSHRSSTSDHRSSSLDRHSSRDSYDSRPPRDELSSSMAPDRTHSHRDSTQDRRAAREVYNMGPPRQPQNRAHPPVAYGGQRFEDHSHADPNNRRHAGQESVPPGGSQPLRFSSRDLDSTKSAQYDSTPPSRPMPPGRPAPPDLPERHRGQDTLPPRQAVDRSYRVSPSTRAPPAPVKDNFGTPLGERYSHEV